MESKIKNGELAFLIFQLSGLNLMAVEKTAYGLETEKITLGTKNKIQKITRTLKEHYDAYNELLIELLRKYDAIESEGHLQLPDPKNPPQAYLDEFKELTETENLVVFEPFDYKKVENVETTNNYDFKSLSILMENYQ